MSRLALPAFFVAVLGLYPQTDGKPPPDATQDAEAPAAAVNPRVQSLDGIIQELYAVISGPKGKARDLAAMKALFLPESRLVPVVARRDGSHGPRPMSLDDYARSFEWMEANGFFESEIHRETSVFGHVAQIFSTYESRLLPDAEPFARGLNSVQLVFDGKRWWISGIAWDQESAEQPIPARYLPE